MSRKLLPVSITAALMGGTAMADIPNVVVDIAPVHSLVGAGDGRCWNPQPCRSAGGFSA